MNSESNYGVPVHWGEKQAIPRVGVRPICQHNFGNNRMLKEPRIMLE